MMEKMSYMRLLRLRFGISLAELADTVGVSQQYVSDIELGKCNQRKSAETLMQKAFELVIKQREKQTRRLAEVYAINSHRLLELAGENNHEL